MADELPTSTQQLVGEIEHEWAELERVLGRLTPEQMLAPDGGGWSPKDNMAHLAAWMGYMRRAALHGVPGHEALGLDEQQYTQLDDDGVNAILFERNRSLSTEQVLGNLRQVHADLMSDLRATPFQDLLKPINARRERPVLQFVYVNTVPHIREHRETIEKAL